MVNESMVIGFYLHKIAVIPLLPTGMVLILLLAGLALRRWVLVAVALLVFWLASTPVVGAFLQHYVEQGAVQIKLQDAPQSDVIVVLSGGGVERRNMGIELYKAGKAPSLVFTGGWNPTRPHVEPEGDVSIRYALGLGVPKAAMWTTGIVTHTKEEAVAVRRGLEARAGDMPSVRPHILLVTSVEHMKRARITFENEGMEISPFAVSFRAKPIVVHSFLDFVPQAISFAQSEAAWRELCGQWFYGLGG